MKQKKKARKRVPDQAFLSKQEKIFKDCMQPTADL
jgi:hypothetical protein